MITTMMMDMSHMTRTRFSSFSTCDADANLNDHDFEDLCNLFEQMFAFDPSKRITIDQIMQHQWFLDNVNSEAIKRMDIGATIHNARMRSAYYQGLHERIQLGQEKQVQMAKAAQQAQHSIQYESVTIFTRMPGVSYSGSMTEYSTWIAQWDENGMPIPYKKQNNDKEKTIQHQ